jgi:DNA-binding NtrC family response regulator
VGHDWPGNVRELENTVEHAVALASGETIQVQDLPPRIAHGGHGSEAPPTADVGPLQQAVARAQEAVERRLIEDALRETGGNRTEAARALGISRRTLFTKIRDLGMEAPSGEPEESG